MEKGITYIIILLTTTLVVGQVEVINLGVLPSTLGENSGLIIYGDKLITHNDSGNGPTLFELDTVSLAVTRTVSILNVDNIDWEDITQDDKYIYIGDIGNNKGTRTDLAIYRVAKQEYDRSASVVAERINYVYEDQSDFTDQGNSDWDAEALFFLDGRLIVLTKQWNSLGTVAYSLPIAPGYHIARRVGELDIGGLVTGASINIDTDELFILGHSMILEPFVHKVGEPNVEDIFQGETLKLDVTLDFAQAEGITYVGNNRFFISSESFTREVPSIMLSAQLMILQLPNIEEETPKEEEKGNFQFSIFPDTDLDKMAYEFSTGQNVLARAVFDVTGRMLRFEVSSEFDDNSFGVSNLNTGVYYLAVYLGDKVVSKPFYRK